MKVMPLLMAAAVVTAGLVWGLQDDSPVPEVASDYNRSGRKIGSLSGFEIVASPFAACSFNCSAESSGLDKSLLAIGDLSVRSSIENAILSIRRGELSALSDFHSLISNCVSVNKALQLSSEDLGELPNEGCSPGAVEDVVRLVDEALQVGASPVSMPHIRIRSAWILDRSILLSNVHNFTSSARNHAFAAALKSAHSFALSTGTTDPHVQDLVGHLESALEETQIAM